MNEPGSVGAEACLRLAVGMGLPTAPRRQTQLPELTAEVLNLAQQHRVVGLLAAAVDAGMVSAGDYGSALRDAHLAAVRTTLVCEETAVLCARSLDAIGVTYRVLKGVAAAHLDFTDPALRQCGDADVLVPREVLDAALRALVTAGFTRPEPPVRGWWERRYGKAVVLVGPNGGELDLHMTLTGGYYGLAMHSETLFTPEPDSFTLAGAQLHALPQYLRLVNVACHSMLGGGSGLRAVRDVAQIASGDPATFVAARQCATEMNTVAVLALALQRAWSLLDLDPAHPACEWATEFTPTAADSARLADYQSAIGTSWLPEGRGALRALAPLDQVGYLAGLVFPSRASLRTRNRTVGQHACRMLTAARGNK